MHNSPAEIARPATEQQRRELARSGLHAALFEQLPDLPPTARILDIGCGTGAWLSRMAEAGFLNLYGVDMDISRASGLRANLIQMDLDEDTLNVGDLKFKLVTMIEVIEHLENPGRLLELLRSKIDDDGWLLITTPNIHSLHARLRYLLKGSLYHFDPPTDPTHVHPIHLPSFKRVLQRRGWLVEREWTYPQNISRGYTRFGTFAAVWFCKAILRDELPGEILCLLCRAI
jgi:SAM-dependent methyltransferase